jgi:AAA+ ATPase superfamily predicted ATPase
LGHLSTELLEIKFDLVQRSPASRKLVWIGFGRVTHFVGREDILAKLKDYHFNSQFKIVAIIGLGGMGKSVLAFQYANTRKDSTNCVCLRGNSKTILLNSLNILALELEIPTSGGDCTQERFEEILISIRSKIKSTEAPWLFILDNVESEHQFIPLLLDTLSNEPNVFIILTSVLRSFTDKRNTACPLELTGFTIEDAVKLIRTSECDGNDEFTRKLSATLQGLPLAMTQAVQYIRDRRNSSFKGKAYGIEDFLAEYHHHNGVTKILDYELVGNEKKTVFTSVKTCLEIVHELENGEDTVTVLHMLSYLDPDGVLVSFLEGLRPSWNSLEILKNYSLISVERETITMHRVLQKIVPQIPLRTVTEQTLLQSVAIRTFKSINLSNVSKMFTHDEIRQATFVWSHVRTSPNLMQSLSKFQLEIERCLQLDLPKVSSPQLLRDLFTGIVDVFVNQEDPMILKRMLAYHLISSLRDLIELELFQRQISSLVKEHGKNHLSVINQKSCIIAYQVGFAMKVNYLEEMNTLIATAEEQLEKDHTFILDLKCKLARCLIEDGKYSSALSLATVIQHNFEASPQRRCTIRALLMDCYSALGDDGQASGLLQDQKWEPDALEEENTIHGIDNQNAARKRNRGKDWSDVIRRFPELGQLLHTVVLNEDTTNKTGSGRSSATYPVLLNPNQRRRETAVHNNFLATEVQFKEFFTHEGNCSKAMEILCEIKKILIS